MNEILDFIIPIIVVGFNSYFFYTIGKFETREKVENNFTKVIKNKSGKVAVVITWDRNNCNIDVLDKEWVTTTNL